MIKFLLILVFVFFPTVQLNAEKYDHQSVQDLYEWGEYDSLLSILPTITSDSSLDINRDTIALYLSYLAVSYYAKGKIVECRSTLLRAITISNSVSYDKRYVPSEVLELLNLVKEDYLEKQRITFQQDSLKKINDEIVRERVLALKQMSVGKQKLTTLNGFFISLAATVITSGLYAVQDYTSRDKYNDYLVAANEGNLLEYNKLKTQLKKSNTTMLLTGVAGSISAMSTLYFGFNYTLKAKRQDSY